jgi:hypothetical protein
MKEKAIELVDKFRKLMARGNPKKCAMLHCDLMIEELNWIQKKSSDKISIGPNIGYFESLKEEIEKL